MADTDNNEVEVQPLPEPDLPRSPEAAEAVNSDKELASRIRGLERRIRRTVTKVRQVTQHGGARAKETAGPALSKTAAGLRKGREHGGLALGAFYRQRFRPFVGRLADTLATRFSSKHLTRDYRQFLLLVHRHGPDRAIEQNCFVPTSEQIPLSILRVPHQLRRSGHDYRPTPRLVFHWAMEMLPEPVRRQEFVDYGAGRGRVLLMASNYPFEKVTGAEIAEELANDCLLNIAQYPRSLMKCRDVNCEHTSALRLPVPDGETIFFLNNPFNPSMFQRVIGQIVRSYKQNPRLLYVASIDMDADGVFEDTGVFERIPMSWPQRTKIAVFSPYSIALYRTIYKPPDSEAEEDDEDLSQQVSDSDP